MNADGGHSSPAQTASSTLVQPKKPPPLIANRELFYGGFFLLITAISAVVVMKVNKRWQKDQLAAAGIAGCLAILLMLVGVPGVRALATYVPIVATLMPYAGILAWMTLIIWVCSSFQRQLSDASQIASGVRTETERVLSEKEADLRRIRDDMGELMEPLKEQLAKAEHDLASVRGDAIAETLKESAKLRADITILRGLVQQMDVEILEQWKGLEARASNSIGALERELGAASKRIDDVRAESVQLRMGDRTEIATLKQAIDLLSREALLTPDRTEAALKQIRGPVHTVTRNGVTTDKQMTYANIHDISEKLDELVTTVGVLVNERVVRKARFLDGLPKEEPEDTRTSGQVQEDFDRVAEYLERGTLPPGLDQLPTRNSVSLPTDIDWRAWGAKPVIELWQGVVLAHGLNPEVYVSAKEGKGDLERQLGLADSCLRDGMGLELERDVNGRRLTSLVSFGEFVDWAHRQGWPLPGPMTMIAAIRKGLRRPP